MRKRLSAKSIECLPPATAKRYEVWDELFPGFGLRVSPKGRRTWFVIGRCGGLQRRHTIGTYPAFSLADARAEGRRILHEMQAGSYASKAKPVERPLSLGDAVPMFIERYAKPKNRSWRSSERILQKFAPLFEVPLSELRRGDVACVLDSIVASGAPYQANRALAAIKKLFAWSVDRGLIEQHPAIGLKPPTKEHSRDRVLADEEIALLWPLWEELGYPFGSLFQLLLLTGQRRTEVAEMRWSEIDGLRAEWRIPSERSKNHKPHIVPLTDAASAILDKLPRFFNSDFVFTTTGNSAVSGFGHLKARLDSTLALEDWRIHDLRRTAASAMARLGTAPHVIEKVLNHLTGSISGVAAVYNRHAYEGEKRGALEQWAGEIQRLVENTRPPSGAAELIDVTSTLRCSSAS